MALKFDHIADVNPSKYDWFIFARVLRLWEVHANDRFRTTTSIEMVLVDEKGAQIHAVVRTLFVKKYERVFKEGSVYSIRGFSVVANEGDYRLTEHEYKINIQGNTKVVLMAGNRVPCPRHMFVPFDEILGGARDPSYLIDVMGILSAIGTERSIEKDGNTTKMNMIELENPGMKLTCTLWGPYVDQLNKHAPATDSPNIIVALFGVKIKEFQGKTIVQTSKHSTKMVFRPDFAEGSDLKRYLDSGKSSTKTVSRLTDSTVPPPEEDFLHLTPRINIADLKHLEGEVDASFIVLGTIESLLDAHEWWYLACNCHKAVKPGCVAYYCPTCERWVTAVTPRYRIKIIVADATDSASFVIFDRPATALFNQQCSEMINEYDQNEGGLECPAKLSGLVGKEMLFKVDIKREKSLNFEPTYTVKRLSDDSDLIKMYKSNKAEIDKEGKHGQPSVTTTENMFNSINSSLQPKNLIGDFESASSASCHDVIQNPNAVNVQPPLPAVVEEGSNANKNGHAPGFNKNKANPLKRAAADIDESNATEFSPKLLKAVKIEKP